MTIGSVPLRAQALALALLAGLVYSDTLDNGFVWDDVFLISRNAATHSLRSVPRLFSSSFFEEPGGASAGGRGSYWRPLTLLSFSLDYAVWGEAPFGYHLTNLILHALNAVLVLLLLRAAPRARAAAFPAAALFACHPLQTNAVAYIAGRTDLLAGFFLLLSCLIVARRRVGEDTAAGRGTLAIFLSVGACTALAVMSKEASFSAPLLILVTAALAPGGAAGSRASSASRWRTPVAAAAASALVLCAAIWWRHRLGIPSPSPASSSPAVVLAAAEGIALYCRLVLLPIGLHMERFVPVPPLSDPGALLSLGAVLLAALLVLRSLFRGGAPPVPLLACWAAAALLPASNIIPIYPDIADRQIFVGEQFLYVPMAGVAGIIACIWVAARGAKDGAAGRLATAAGAAVLALFGVLAFAHNEYWKDELAFYSRTLALSPGSVRMSANLGMLKAREGDYDESLRLLAAVASQNPRSSSAHLNLGQTYRMMERFDDARRELLEALRLYPGAPDVLNALGSLSMATGDYAGAVSRFRAAIKASPLNPDLRTNLAAAYMYQGATADAEEALRGALAIDPESASAGMLLGLCMERQGRVEEAREIYRSIARRHPGFTPAAERADRLSKQ